MVELTTYSKDFYADQEVSSLQSAKALLPVLHQLFEPKSVVDVGCGIGAWLKTWETAFSLTDYFGIEAPFVKKELMLIPDSKLLLTNLNQPFALNRRFDMAMSLEVAEHIEPAAAQQFVDSLVALSDLVVFSAAIPGQEGTFHVNEQYPEYWAERFARAGYSVVDCLREGIWHDARINYWYRQNILVFVKTSQLHRYPALEAAAVTTKPGFLNRIHPELLAYKTDRIKRLNTPLGYWRQQGYFLKLRLRKLIKR
jgi:SAM-dependent methyltransferase